MPGIAALMEGGFPQLKRSLNPVPPKQPHTDPNPAPQNNFTAHLRPSKNTETPKEPKEPPPTAPRKIGQSAPAPSTASTTHTGTFFGQD